MIYGAIGHAGNHHRAGPAAAVRLEQPSAGRPADPCDGRHRSRHLQPFVSSPWWCSRAWPRSTFRLEEAAMDLGAPPAERFLPSSPCRSSPRPCSAGWLLSFTLSLDDVVISSFATGPGSTTLPIVIFSKVRLGVSPEINALASIMIAVDRRVAVIYGVPVREAHHRARRPWRRPQSDSRDALPQSRLSPGGLIR